MGKAEGGRRIRQFNVFLAQTALLQVVFCALAAVGLVLR